MNAYLLLKWVHIVSSMLLVGTGFGSAFYLYFANRTRNVAAIAEVSRLVVRADYWFTAPTVVIQPLSGIALVNLANYSWTEPWLLIVYALFILAGACWLPVVWLQIRMARMASDAAANGAALPDLYWSHALLWERLGMVAFPAMLLVYYLMVFRPVF